MKKILTTLAVLFLPLSIWAMTPVNDDYLALVSGQAGVNINADLTMNISIGTMAWGDNDGISSVYTTWSTNASGGYIGITGFAFNNLQVKARTSAGDTYNSYSTLLLKPITIDVATAPTGGYSTTNYDGSVHNIAAGTTFVRIGLGALQVSFDQLQFDVALGTHESTGYIGVRPELDQTLGTVTIGGVDVHINPWSYVDIYNSRTSPTTQTGVTFAFNIVLDHVSVPYMSWGDGDGLASSSTEPNGIGYPAGFRWISSNNSSGYIGLNNLTIGHDSLAGVIVTGTVAVDVVTTTDGTYSYLYSLFTALKPASYYINNHSESNIVAWIDLMINDGTIDLNNGTEVTDFIKFYIHYVLHGPASAYNLHYTQYPLTLVHISFPTDMNVTVDSIWADVVLSNVSHLGHMDGETGYTDALVADNLGDIFIEGINFKVKAGSWIDIWAQ